MVRYLAVREADFDRAVTITQQLQPDASTLPPHTFMRDYIAADASTRDAMISRLARTGDPIVGEVSYLLRQALADHDAADRLLFSLPLETRRDSIGRSRDLASSLAARGRMREAWPQFQQLAALHPDQGRWAMMLCVQLAIFEIAPADLTRLLALVESADSASANVPSDPYDWDHLLPHMRLYHLAFINLRLGNLAEVRRLIDRLTALPTPEPRQRGVHALVESLQVRLLMEEGRWSEALRRHEAISLAVPLDMGEIHPERFIRAELLLRAGRANEALRWLDHLDGFFGGGAVYILDAPRALRRAQAYELLDRPEDALVWYGRFMELWQNADPEYAPLVRTARERTSALLQQSR